MAAFLLNFWQAEEGQDLVEYTLLMTFIALACAAIIGAGRPAVNNIWIGANNQLTQANTAALGGGS
jgi:Flp pilus assembly pilin Flp